MSKDANPTIIIVGTGFGGLCMAAQLKRSGRDDFIILEKAGSVGGTWRENRYPGAECDVGSNLYSYSFFPNPDWDHRWAKQKQILDYQNQVVEAFDLRGHIHFGKTVTEAVFDEGRQSWHVKTQDGTKYTARHFILALGQLHHPSTPKFDGKELFKGQQFHTAEWPDDIDLAGKNIAMIGNAASAIQAAPTIAKLGNRLTIYQRSANWMMPKGDRPFTRFEKFLFRRLPGYQKLNRLGWFALGELLLYPAIQGKKLQSKALAWAARRNMDKHIKDPELRKALTPDYPVGAKRILFVDNYYETLARENVLVAPNGAARINAEGIETPDGKRHAHDIIVYATGFKTDPFYQKLSISGEGGKTLAEHWSGGARAYHGVMTASFPNMFMLYGPNTNTGHTSIIFKLENQVSYILQLLEKSKGRAIAVKDKAEQDFDDEMQMRLNQTAWAKVENSWYKQNGRIANNWPGSGREYKRRMKTPIWDDYEIG